MAVLNVEEQFHATASGRRRPFGWQGCRLVLTDEVFVETGNGLVRTPASFTCRQPPGPS